MKFIYIEVFISDFFQFLNFYSILYYRFTLFAKSIDHFICFLKHINDNKLSESLMFWWRWHLDIMFLSCCQSFGLGSLGAVSGHFRRWMIDFQTLCTGNPGWVCTLSPFMEDLASFSWSESTSTPFATGMIQARIPGWEVPGTYVFFHTRECVFISGSLWKYSPQLHPSLPRTVTIPTVLLTFAHYCQQLWGLVSLLLMPEKLGWDRHIKDQSEWDTRLPNPNSLCLDI
jgi:hypothetical protein